MAKITIYSTPTCTYCVILKNYLKEKGIEYEEIDVSTDLGAQKEMIDKSGQMGVPVSIIGEEVIVGFDRERIAELLSIEE
jgi:glutaredoxin-like YruB-family protein